MSARSAWRPSAACSSCAGPRWPPWRHRRCCSADCGARRARRWRSRPGRGRTPARAGRSRRGRRGRGRGRRPGTPSHWRVHGRRARRERHGRRDGRARRGGGAMVSRPLGAAAGVMADRLLGEPPVAANTVDAVVAPALWTAVVGAPGAFAYRAVNTLDAMVGHRSLRYEHFGWASARLDDLAGLIPARVTAGLVAAVRPRSAARVARAVRDDAPAHPSPNAGIAEAAFPAPLGLRLGGTNRYGDRA